MSQMKQKLASSGLLLMLAVQVLHVGCCGQQASHSGGGVRNLQWGGLIAYDDSWAVWYGSRTRVGVGLATYEEMFGLATRARYSAQRIALVLYIIHGDSGQVDTMLLRVLAGKKFSPKEKELAAGILWLRERCRCSPEVVAYYVGKFHDPTYERMDPIVGRRQLGAITRDLGISEMVHSVTGEKAKDRDGSVLLCIPSLHPDKVKPGYRLKERTYIPSSEAYGVVVELSKCAVPELLPLLADKSLTTRMNAYAALTKITSLDLPYDPVRGRDNGVRGFLESKGWLGPETTSSSADR